MVPFFFSKLRYSNYIISLRCCPTYGHAALLLPSFSTNQHRLFMHLFFLNKLEGFGEIFMSQDRCEDCKSTFIINSVNYAEVVLNRPTSHRDLYRADRRPNDRHIAQYPKYRWFKFMWVRNYCNCRECLILIYWCNQFSYKKKKT